MNPLFVLIQLQFWWNMFLGSQPLAGAEPTSPTKKDSKHRFEIIKKLGSGTYGKVSLAFDHKFDREVRSSFLIFKLEKSYRYLQSVAMGLRHNLVEDSLFMKTGAFLQSSFPVPFPASQFPSLSLSVPLSVSISGPVSVSVLSNILSPSAPFCCSHFSIFLFLFPSPLSSGSALPHFIYNVKVRRTHFLSFFSLHPLIFISSLSFLYLSSLPSLFHSAQLQRC